MQKPSKFKRFLKLRDDILFQNSEKLSGNSFYRIYTERKD